MSHQTIGARDCKSDISGESKLYFCPRDEYCCNIGCCTISPSFQFYQLWYYWFMVFFMFLICSGGQWWYRYVIQGRCASAMPPPARRASYPRQCRVAYTPARDTVVLHHLWKPPYTGIHGPPPSYSQSGAGSSTGLGGSKMSPYMQLYGPPPSYESVFGAGPLPVHQLPSAGSPSIGLDPQGGQMVVEQQRFESLLPPPASHHLHHRQGSSGSELNSSTQHSAAAGSSGQSVPPGGGGPHHLQHTAPRKCASVRPHHQHHPHHHHMQKVVVEQTRESGQSLPVPPVGEQPSPPNQRPEQVEVAESEVACVQRPLPEDLPPPCQHGPDPADTLAVIPPSVINRGQNSIAPQAHQA